MVTDNLQKQKLAISQELQKTSKTEQSQGSLGIPDAEKEKIIRNWANFENRFAGKPFLAKTPEQKKYLKKVTSKEDFSLKSMLRKATAKEERKHKQPIQKMAYDDAKKILWKIIQTKLASQGRKFEHDGNDLVVIRDLLKYFIGDPSGDLDLRKGICLSGDVGMGKTFLMECFMSFAKITNNKTFGKIGCGDIYEEIGKASKSRFGSSAAAMSKYYKKNLFFDDLGNEPLVFQDYGNKIEFMDRIFFKREESFRNGLCISHITTNLKGKEIAERYGKRFFDRFKQMFNVLVMTAPSKRK